MPETLASKDWSTSHSPDSASLLRRFERDSVLSTESLYVYGSVTGTISPITVMTIGFHPHPSPLPFEGRGNCLPLAFFRSAHGQASLRPCHPSRKRRRRSSCRGLGCPQINASRKGVQRGGAVRLRRMPRVWGCYSAQRRCHCEERSDEAISGWCDMVRRTRRLPRRFRLLAKTGWGRMGDQGG